LWSERDASLFADGWGHWLVGSIRSSEWALEVHSGGVDRLRVMTSPTILGYTCENFALPAD